MDHRHSHTPTKYLALFLILIASGLFAAGVMVVGEMRASASGQPISNSLALFSGKPTYVLSPADATATPTPFQPLAPTASQTVPPVTEIPPTEAAITLVISPTPTPTPAGFESPAASQPTAAPTSLTPVPTSLTPMPTPASQLTAAPSLEKLPRQINLLLLGADRRPYEAGFRTDTIMLVTINTELGRVNITSFPRDLWVMLPGWGNSRINTAWTYGGWNMLRDTFQHNFGVKVDYHMLIDFGAFKKIIDSLGGLNVNVAEPVSDYKYGYWVTIKKGPQHMDADTVLWYVRTRKTTNDIARNRRQQEVLQALLDKFVSVDAVRRAPEIWDLYDNSIKTDIKLIDVLKWLPFAARIVETRDIHPYYITYKQVYDWITPEGAMVLVPNRDALMKVIRNSQNLK